MGVFFVVVSMATLGEIRIGRGELGETRVWLIRESDEHGLGFSSTRLVHGSEAEGSVCVETRVRFLMWRTAEPAQPVRFCGCMKKEGETWTPVGECPAAFPTESE